MKTNPWDTVLITYRQTGTLPPCPFCSRAALTVEQTISCAHTTQYIYCSNCGKWGRCDSAYEDQ